MSQGQFRPMLLVPKDQLSRFLCSLDAKWSIGPMFIYLWVLKVGCSGLLSSYLKLWKNWNDRSHTVPDIHLNVHYSRNKHGVFALSQCDAICSDFCNGFVSTGVKDLFWCNRLFMTNWHRYNTECRKNGVKCFLY